MKASAVPRVFGALRPTMELGGGVARVIVPQCKTRTLGAGEEFKTRIAADWHRPSKSRAGGEDTSRNGTGLLRQIPFWKSASFGFTPACLKY
jgi:hypothetical protein